ncbi:MAG: hypothetical protein DKINENOH_03431 [bacterium]|nr:hypothetical protein [bacterium]MCK6557594.1 DUF971 domain-containing protein [bacterium]NUM64918.1 DUF971 domain-containing protein [candidate division KSB1 bacterium]
MPTPINIFPIDNQTLGIDWDDHSRTTYGLRFLRGNCRCAACVDEVTGQRLVFPEHIPENIRALEARPVGRYAIQFLWSDGHESGIYTFDYLRELVQKS